MANAGAPSSNRSATGGDRHAAAVARAFVIIAALAAGAADAGAVAGTVARAPRFRAGTSFPSTCPAWALPGAAHALPPLPSPLPAGVATALAATNATLHSLLDGTAHPGFGFSLYYRGAEVASWGGGVGDKATGRAPNVTRDVFRIASNTKVLISMLALAFKELGLIASLDDPVSRYAPDFRGPVVRRVAALRGCSTRCVLARHRCVSYTLALLPRCIHHAVPIGGQCRRFFIAASCTCSNLSHA